MIRDVLSVKPCMAGIHSSALARRHDNGWKMHDEAGQSRFLASALTAFLAVLDAVALEFSGADPLGRPPLQRDRRVADVVDAQSSGFTRRS